MDKPINVKWVLRKVNVRPCCYLADHRKEEKMLVFAYLLGRAFKFNTKEAAQNYARSLYQDFGIAWEPEAIATEENNDAEKTF